MMIKYNEVKNLSEDEIIKLLESIGKEYEKIATTFNSMPESERKKHTNMVTRCELLEFKFYSLRDILWFKQGNIQIELPDGIDYPDGGIHEKILKKRLRKKIII